MFVRSEWMQDPGPRPKRAYTTTVPSVVGSFEAVFEPFEPFLIGGSVSMTGLELDSSS